LLGGEADGCEVVAGPDFEFVRVGLHEFEGAADCVIHEYHGDGGVLPDKALVGALLQCAVEDVDGVVGGATAGQFFPADDPRVPQAAHVQPVLVEIILAEQFARILGDAVHSGGLDDCVLRSIDFGSGGPEDRN